MGTNRSRRNFLKMLGAGTCGTIAHNVLNPYNGLVAYAQSMPTPGADLPVLVVVNMSGGCSYNLAPIYNGAYRDKNPNISFGPEAASVVNNMPAGSHALDENQGLHPALTGLAKIYHEDKNLALINQVGYPNPNRSHDESTQIWFRGIRTGGNGGGGVAGWGARLTSQMASVNAGFSLGGSNLLINGGMNPPRSLGSIQNMTEGNLPYGTGNTWFQMTRDELALNLGSQYSDTKHNRQIVAAAIESAGKASVALKAETNKPLPAGITFQTNGNGFANECLQAAQLIRAKSLGVQFIYMEIGGFDTHSMERTNLNNRLTQLNSGLTSLADFLKHPEINRWKDVTIVTMTEFCRTFENGSEGTDHGHAGPMLVMGGGVKQGIKSPTPTAAQITSANGYLHQYAVDFREPFYGAIKKMGLNADLVFPETFNTKNLDIFS